VDGQRFPKTGDKPYFARVAEAGFRHARGHVEFRVGVTESLDG
jgi:hypothetical protein